MKSSRLVSLLLLLQARGRATASELADELEVSVRTVYRDIADLGAAGVPVYGERGDGGGYRLVDGYRTDLTGLTADEAGTLLLAGAPGPAAQLGLGSLLAATRLKLLAAVPPGLRRTATRAEQRFHLDPATWSHQRAHEHDHLATIARAVWQDRRLRLDHRRAATSPVVRRTVSPLGLVHKTGVWYLVAIHGTAPLVYRVDRVTGAVPLDAAAERPEGFDLATFWAGWEADYAARLPSFTAVVRLGPDAMRYRDRLGPLAPRAVEDERTDPDGWVRQSLRFDSPGIAAAALLAIGPSVEVVEPDELRDRLAATAEAILDRCGGAQGRRRIAASQEQVS